MIFTIDINVNVPGVLPILVQLKELIMTIADDTATIKAAAQGAADQITALNTKVDNLIVVASTAKDALVALQQAGTSIDPAELTDIVGILSGATTAATAEGTKVDAAAVADAP